MTSRVILFVKGNVHVIIKLASLQEGRVARLLAGFPPSYRGREYPGVVEWVNRCIAEGCTGRRQKVR
jgi:hypothetical protein